MQNTVEPKKEYDNERGAVMVVEAAFVFPIMFIVLFILMMLSDAHFQYSRVTRMVVNQAISSAAYCENPMLATVVENGTTPEYSKKEDYIKPYRYWLGKLASSEVSQQENIARKRLESEIEGLTSWGFAGLTIQNVQVSTEYKRGAIVSHFIIQCNFSVELPIRMLFEKENFTVDYAVRVEQPVGDPAEFVRNISLAQDYLERSGFDKKIAETLKPVTDFLNVLN